MRARQSASDTTPHEENQTLTIDIKVSTSHHGEYNAVCEGAVEPDTSQPACPKKNPKNAPATGRKKLM